MDLASAKIAVVHEWIVDFAGSEKVLDEILGLFPDADLYCVCASERTIEQFTNIKSRSVHTTIIQRFPFFEKLYKLYLPLMPFAIEQLDFREYDIVISSSHAVAKGVITGPDCLHVSYVHSPMRYVWDLKAQYLRESSIGWSPLGILKRWLLHRLRLWDVASSSGVDIFVSNSNFIGRRIEKCYRRTALTVYPPVDVSKFDGPPQARESFYICASRLVPYKKVDVVVDAFRSMPDKKLVVIGGGPDFSALSKSAPSTVSFVGRVDDKTLVDLFKRARGFVFAAEEDFGIFPVEAQAAGTPVIAYKRGGAAETVLDIESSSRPTGILFEQQSAESIVRAVTMFEDQSYNFDPQCRDNAHRFSKKVFRRRFMGVVEEAFENHIAAVNLTLEE